MFFLDHIWLVPLLPAAGAAIMFFFGRKLQKADGQRGLRRRSGAGVCLRLPGGLAVHRIRPRQPGQAFRENRLHLAGHRHRPHELRQTRRHSGRIPCRCRLPARSSFRHLAAVCHRRRHAHPYLFHRLHGARGRLLPLLRISQPVHVLHAHAHPGEQLRLDVCGMGRRGPVLVSADRFLFPSPVGQHRRQQGIHRQPHR